MIPHCKTCRCVAPAPPLTDAAALTWQPYSLTTTGTRVCSGCADETVMPGRHRWVWRKLEANGTRRKAQSLCPRCQVLLASGGAREEK